MVRRREESESGFIGLKDEQDTVKQKAMYFAPENLLIQCQAEPVEAPIQTKSAPTKWPGHFNKNDC